MKIKPDVLKIFSKFKRDVYILLGAIGLLLVPKFFIVENNERLYFAFFEEKPLPTTCLMKNLTGFDCPTCGMSRSFVAWTHGDYKLAWDLHRLSIVLIVIIIFQIPYRILVLITGRRLTVFSNPRFINVFSYGLILLFFFNWILNLFFK